VRTRSIALAASVLAHAAIFAIALRATKHSHAPSRSVIELVPLPPALPKNVSTLPDDHRPAPETGERAVGKGRPSTTKPHRSAPADARAQGPEISEARPDAPREAKDLSKVDLELHALPDALPEPIARAETGRSGASGSARMSPGGGAGALEPSGEGTYLHRDTHFHAHVDYDGTVDFEGHGRSPSIGSDDEGRGTIKIPLDVTDMILGAAGQDPYAYEKRKFMAATQGLRQAMYDRACKEQLSDAVLDMRPRLESIWKNETLSPSERRLLIFQLWDQCAEDGPPDVKRTTEQIRAIIVAFINERMPKASRYAYSDQDLEHLNRTRRSVERFMPYE
jgi:hypothetical protein